MSSKVLEQTRTRTDSRSNIRSLAVAAMLSAVAFVLMYVAFPIPALIPTFVKLDVSDLPALLAAFALGPVYGVVVSFVKNLLYIIFHSTSSAYMGQVFSFVMGSVFSFTAGFVYHWKKSRTSALIGSVVGSIVMALLSVPLNYFLVYPAYEVAYGLPMDSIIQMYQAILPSADSLLKCLVIFNLPFTFVKGMLDTVLCFLIYKPLSPILHGKSA